MEVYGLEMESVVARWASLARCDSIPALPAATPVARSVDVASASNPGLSVANY